MLNWLKKTPNITVKYNPNDPRVQDLSFDVSVPVYTSAPRFAVQGWNGSIISDIQKQAAHVYTSLTLSIQMVQSYLERPFTSWAAVDTLLAIPRGMRQANAYYDRSSLKFGFFPGESQMVFTSDSNDVVNHELGHAILDALRPDLWNKQALEIFAFHEAFGDINSILSTLQHDVVIDKLLSQNERLDSSNFVTRLAEQFGNTLWVKNHRGSENYLRDAFNELTYTPPEQLSNAEREPHSFSRIFVGAFYEILWRIFEEERKTVAPNEALKRSRDFIGKVFYNATLVAACNPRFFESVAKSMISIAGIYASVMRKVFANRNILKDVLFASNEIFAGDQSSAIKIGKLKFIRSKHMQHMDVGVLFKLGAVLGEKLPYSLSHTKIEPASESNIVVNKHKKVVDKLLFDPEATREAARASVTYLQQNDCIGYQQADEHMFLVINGKLVRNRSCFACCHGVKCH